MISIDELEKEWRDNLKGEQGAIFYGVKCETEFSQVVYGDKRSSLGHLGDDGSANGQISFLCLSGRARWCLKYFVVLPSVRSENVKWCSDESDYEREKELQWFKLNRGYGELMEKMNIKRIMINNVDIPCAVLDNDYIYDKYVPVGRISVLVMEEYDEKITCLGVTKDIYGDRMEITNVDRLYESIGSNGIKCYIDNVYNNNKVSVSKNEKCYKKIRLLHDDGG